MKIISFDKIKDLQISPMEWYRWVDELLHRKQETVLPPKISMKPGMEGVFYNCMPSVIPFESRAGLKLVTRYPGREPSLKSEILLYDLQTGETLALMDGTYITAVRTGAVAAHSIKLFAVNEFKEIGIMGLGNTAIATLLTLLSLYPDREIRIKLLKYKQQHEFFAKRFSEYKNVEFVFVDMPEQLVKDSDVIISAATFLDSDVCKDDSLFKEGCTLVPVHTRGFTNCDLFFDKVFADDRGHVQGFKYFDKFKSFAEVSDVLTGNKPGRENDKERILCYNIGISIHDIFFASRIYSLIEDCPETELNDCDVKTWM